MVERQYKAFQAYEIDQARKKFPNRPPLSFTQQELFRLAIEYKKVTGEKIPQQVLANETDVTRGAVNLQVREIFEKGYYPPIVTKDLIPRLPRRNRRKLEALRKRRNLIERVKELRLRRLTIGQLQEVTGEDKNVLLGILDYLRKREETPRLRKRRTPQEIAALKENIKRLNGLGLSDREIAQQTGESYRVITNFKSAMIASDEIKRKYPMKKLE